MNLTPADDVDDGGRIDVFTVVVAVIKDVTELVFEVNCFLSPLHLRSLSVKLVQKGRETTLGSIMEELEMRFESAYYDDAIPSNQFAQCLKSMIHGRQMRMIRL